MFINCQDDPPIHHPSACYVKDLRIHPKPSILELKKKKEKSVTLLIKVILTEHDVRQANTATGDQS